MKMTVRRFKEHLLRWRLTWAPLFGMQKSVCCNVFVRDVMEKNKTRTTTYDVLGSFYSRPNFFTVSLHSCLIANVSGSLFTAYCCCCSIAFVFFPVCFR
ncbi:unnamed protein product [Amoebophrya sp. A120]|nr:unnamed protein product [Amoebophrya sp. A120]|eukprot:GSA120T00019752001.1